MSAVLRRAAVITAAIALLFGLTTSTAGAIPTGGPGEVKMIVSSYYQHGTLVGRRWFGCPYDPNGGSWGTLSGQLELSFLPC